MALSVFLASLVPSSMELVMFMPSAATGWRQCLSSQAQITALRLPKKKKYVKSLYLWRSRVVGEYLPWERKEADSFKHQSLLPSTGERCYQGKEEQFQDSSGVQEDISDVHSLAPSGWEGVSQNKSKTSSLIVMHSWSLWSLSPPVIRAHTACVIGSEQLADPGDCGPHRPTLGLCTSSQLVFQILYTHQ